LGLFLLQKQEEYVQVNNRQNYFSYAKTLKNLNQITKELKIHDEISI